MKSLGKLPVHICVNGTPNGKIQTKMVYENTKGELFINHLSSKKQIHLIDGKYSVNFSVRSINAEVLPQ